MVCTKCGEPKPPWSRFCPFCSIALIIIIFCQIVGVSLGVIFVDDRGDIKEVLTFATVGAGLGGVTGVAVSLFVSFVSNRARR